MSKINKSERMPSNLFDLIKLNFLVPAIVEAENITI